MTFDHKIDVEPATIGSAAMASRTERQAIVRKVLVAQPLQTVPVQQQRFVMRRQHNFRCLWATPRADPPARSARARPKPRHKEDICLW
jgi:hypothetical protein